MATAKTKRPADALMKHAKELAPGSNWLRLQAELQKATPARKQQRHKRSRTAAPAKAVLTTAVAKVTTTTTPAKEVTKFVALDCEMVGIGPHGKRSALARVSVVDFHGAVLYDQIVQPNETVTDWRTRWSGITPEMMKNAIPFTQAQREVAALINGHVVIGHSLNFDFDALLLVHPPALQRDTAKYKPLHGAAGLPRSLKILASEMLGLNVQMGSHSSVEDARTVLMIYKRVQHEWEKYLSEKEKQLQQPASVAE